MTRKAKAREGHSCVSAVNDKSASSPLSCGMDGPSSSVRASVGCWSGTGGRVGGAQSQSDSLLSEPSSEEDAGKITENTPVRLLLAAGSGMYDDTTTGADLLFQ